MVVFSLFGLLGVMVGAGLGGLNPLAGCSTPLPGPDRLARYGRAATAIAGSDLAGLTALAEGADGAAYHSALTAARHPGIDPPRRVDLLRQAINLYPGPGLGHELAQALEAAGSKGPALEEWSRFLPSAPAVEAVRRLAPDPVSGTSALNSGGAHQAALDWLKQAGAAGPKADLERSRALAGLGRPAGALAGFESYLAANPNDQRAILAYARALEALGRNQAALIAYLQAGPKGAGRAGLILENRGRTNEAAPVYLKSDDPEHRWIAALIYESAGRTAEALKVYRELAVTEHRVRDDAAQRIRRITGEKEPGNGNRAGGTGDSAAPGGAAAPGGPRGVSPGVTISPEVAEGLKRADALWSKGSALVLPGESGISLAGLEMEIAVRRSYPAERLAIAEWYAGKGNLRRAMTIAHGLVVPGTPGHPVPGLAGIPKAAERAGRLAYPLIFHEAARTAAQEFRLEPALIMAVIREESFFNPEAVSTADARGLMQLLPSTGKWIAGKLGLPVSDQDLYQPEVNIRLGSWYLRYLVDRWDGDQDKAIASYNGGDGNVSRWIKNPLYKESVDLPAVLVYPETREYLTKVNNSRQAYRRLYGDDLTER